MEEYIGVLKTAPLFSGLDDGEILRLIERLGATVVSVASGGYALRAGDRPYIGVVLSGRLHVTREDENGGRALLTSLTPGDIFGEALVCANVAESPVAVNASEPSAALRLEFEALATDASLMARMAGVVARKNLMLQRRMEILEQKSIRERLLLYLEGMRPAHGGAFNIPLDRAGLADYLAADRSALSRELGRLRDEGIIDFHKNSFILRRS